MKIGELEVPDSAVEAFLKSSGKRIVEDSDYVSKAAAAADLVKFRAVTGEGRSIEEIQAIMKAHEEADKKNKTQTELLQAELKRIQAELQAQAGEVKKAQREVRVRDVKQYFEQAQEANKLKIIDPILEPFRQEFYDAEDSKYTPETLKAAVEQSLLKASELQKGELLRLGIAGVTQESSGPSFGAGYSSDKVNVGQAPGRSAGNETDLWSIMKETSASPLGVPIGRPPQKP